MSNRRPYFEKATKGGVIEALQDVLGEGADVDDTNPLHVTTEIIVDTISTTSSQAISGGETAYYPDSDGVSIEGYALKTITVKSDYRLTGAIEISDDSGSTWENYYPVDHEFELVEDKMETMSFQEDFEMVRIKLVNGDVSDHTVNFVKIKGRNI